MSHSDNTYVISGGQQKLGSDVGSWMSSTILRLQRLGATLAAKRARAREMAELNQFTDRELWDVGLSRSDLLSIEKGVYSRD